MRSPWSGASQDVVWIDQATPALAIDQPLPADQDQKHPAGRQFLADGCEPVCARLDVVDVLEHQVLAEAQAQVVG